MKNAVSYTAAMGFWCTRNKLAAIKTSSIACAKKPMEAGVKEIVIIVFLPPGQRAASLEKSERNHHSIVLIRRSKRHIFPHPVLRGPQWINLALHPCHILSVANRIVGRAGQQNPLTHIR
jgi:hypothetical protein